LFTYNLLRAAIKFDSMGQQIKISAFSNKHGPFWLRYHPRENSIFSYLCSCIGPLATCPRTKNPSPAKTSLPVVSGSYDLFFTSGLHRLGDQTTLSRPPLTAASMIGNATTPQAAPGSRRFVRGLGFHKARRKASERIFFADGAEGSEVRERALGSPTHLLAHRRAWRRRTGRGSSAPPLSLSSGLALLSLPLSSSSATKFSRHVAQLPNKQQEVDTAAAAQKAESRASGSGASSQP
jgi:hypothetical protein